MKSALSIPRSALPDRKVRTPRSIRGFTMVEIALSLAIIGFALVAIIGVLPAGMSVQKDNREQTVINLDAAYLMDAIRSGPLGQDNLTNYIVSITQTSDRYEVPANLGLGAFNVNPDRSSYTFTSNQTVIDTSATGLTASPFSSLTNGFNIIGLLSMPKYALYSLPVQSPPTVYIWSNSVTAVFRAINGPAVDQGPSQASRDFAFQYQVTIEIVPAANSPYMAQTANWVNLAAPNFINITNPSSATVDALAQNLQNNLYDIQLTFRWPVLPNGQLGGGKQVFRSSVAGTYLTSSPPLPPPVTFPPPSPFPMGQSYVLPSRAYLFFMQPATYTALTP
jgi:type II secretory pathway pseudopilin PulG